jgi:membrane protease YdiL (CAAX protease family)
MRQTTGRQTNAWLAILGTSIFVAVAHLDFSPIPLVNITLYAVFASFIALGQGNAFGLPVSGNPEANSLFAFGPAAGSNDGLSGGSSASKRA